MKILALADLVAAADVLLVHRLGGLCIDKLLLEPVTGLPEIDGLEEQAGDQTRGEAHKRDLG